MKTRILNQILRRTLKMIGAIAVLVHVAPNLALAIESPKEWRVDPSLWPPQLCAIDIVAFPKSPEEEAAAQQGQFSYPKIGSCSGTLVAPDRIHTAGHCFEGLVGGHNAGVAVACGFFQVTSGSQQDFLFHKQYSYKKISRTELHVNHDHAEIILDKAIDPEQIPPMRIATAAEVANFTRHGPCAIFGYAPRQAHLLGKRARPLTSSWVRIYNPPMTDFGFPDLVKYTEDKSVWVGNSLNDKQETGVVAEPGDSGGPMACLDKEKKWVLAGVVSALVKSQPGLRYFDPNIGLRMATLVHLVDQNGQVFPAPPPPPASGPPSSSSQDTNQ